MLTSWGYTVWCFGRLVHASLENHEIGFVPHTGRGHFLLDFIRSPDWYGPPGDLDIAKVVGGIHLYFDASSGKFCAGS